MEQMTMLSQYDIDRSRFIELFSKFTGISQSKIYNFLEHNPIRNIFEHPTGMDVNLAQLNKIIQLKELNNLYNNLKSFDREYIINSTSKGGEYFKEYFSSIKDKERFVCAFLDNGLRIITTKVLSTGTVNETPVYPRELSKIALLYDANAVILSHNHPGGSLHPSTADLKVTQSIVDALSTLDIKVLDHIIVADDKFVSLADRGYSFVPSYISESSHVKESNINLKDKIVKLYNEEFPAIKHISDSTAEIIDRINQSRGKVISINELKQTYNQIGKNLEKNNDPENRKLFDAFEKVINDFKQAQLKDVQIKVYDKPIKNEYHVSKNIDIER